MAEEKLGRRAAEYAAADADLDDDDYTPDEQEAMEEQVVDHASAAATIAELEAEMTRLLRRNLITYIISSQLSSPRASGSS